MVTLQTVGELLDRWELVTLVVAVLIRLARAWQAELTWPEYRATHACRRRLFPVFERYAPVVSWVNDKRGRDDAEYVATLDQSVSAVVRTLRSGGGSLHLISSVKRRPDTHGDPLSVAHCLWTHADDDGDGNAEQTEAYLFRNDDGTTDVYAHYEGSVDGPLDHLTGGQTNGDVRGVVRDALTAE